MALPWNKGIFSHIKQVTPNTRLFFIKLEGIEVFDFKPGQFVTLDLPIHERPARRWRSYSIASAPNGSSEIELVIVLLEGGAGSNYLFNNIKVGQEVPVRGPQGIFTLPEQIDRDLFFICTGTGIAPFRSMLLYIRDNHIILHHHIYLIFGTRRQEDLLYPEDMRQLEKDLKNFHYIPTLSREKWDGETGYVHPIYERLAENRRPIHFYLCGWKEMIREARERIKAMGYDRKAIHQELYG